MKYNWHLHLTQKQFEALKDGLLSYFRFQLRLAVETVTYNFQDKTFSVFIESSTQKESVSCYINGFYKAINA